MGRHAVGVLTAGTLAAGALVAGALVTACEGGADDRARRDQEIGTVSIGGTIVRVEPGVIRGASDGSPPSITVWASAPVVEIDVEGDVPIDLRVENLTPDVEIVGGVSKAARFLADGPTVRRGLVDRPGRIILAPAAVEAERPVRVVFLSDIHASFDDLDDVFATINALPDVDLVLAGGDLVDFDTDSEWDELEQMISTLTVPFYSTVGNHELVDGNGERYHQRLGRMSYAFDYHGVRFVTADSASGTVAPQVFAFIDEALEQPGADLRVFVTHIPPFDASGLRDGGFANHLEAARLLDLLARHDVALTLYGHIHGYEAFANADIPAYIAGGAGEPSSRSLDGVDEHFLLLEIDPITRSVFVELNLVP
jgi:Icc-related predicted phosphoesterase